jgi:hypothetical protein
MKGGMDHKQKDKGAWSNLKENINGLPNRGNKDMLQMSQSVANFYRTEQKREFRQR